MGELLLHDGNPVFHAHFRGSDDDLFVQRGQSHDHYADFEEGLWHLEGDRLCFSNAFDVIDGCFSLHRDGDIYVLGRDDGRIVWAGVHDEAYDQKIAE
ncbi:MAG: hypothetical protein CMM46_15025 [Rhodospirillaceae bacterium]|nr:hypothetical protein [Rhodospirillaceae bacterium]